MERRTGEREEERDEKMEIEVGEEMARRSVRRRRDGCSKGELER